MRQKRLHDLIIVWLVANHIVSDESIPALEVDDFIYQLIDLHLLNVDDGDKKLQEAFSLNILNEMLLTLEKLRSNVLGVGDLKVVGFDVDERLDEKTVE